MKQDKSSREWESRIQDILDCISKIERYTKNMTYENFTRNELVIDAVVRNFEIIGEAGNYIPKNIQKIHPECSLERNGGDEEFFDSPIF